MSARSREARRAPCTLARQKRLVTQVLKNQPGIRCTPAELKRWTGLDRIDFDALVQQKILQPAGAYYILAPEALM